MPATLRYEETAHYRQELEAAKRENAFRVFASTPRIIAKQHEETVLQAFQKGFKDDAVSVRLPSLDPGLALYA